jgi:group I intron endonuclease
MLICQALLKYDYYNFSLEIIEYCEVSELLTREKYYIDLGSEYNIVKDPTIPPMSGRNHSDESKTKISDSQKKIDHSGRFKTGEDHPMFGHNHSDETKTKISDSHKKIDHSGRFKIGEDHPMFGKTGENNPNFGKTLSEETKTKISDTMKGHKGAAQSTSQKIEVTDVKTNNKTSYNSLREAARALEIDVSIISQYFKNNRTKRAPPFPPQIILGGEGGAFARYFFKKVVT